MNNECFDSHPGGLGKIPGVGTIIIHFLGEQTKQKVQFLLEIARFMKTNPIKGAAWHHRKFRFNQTKPKLAWLGWVVRSISGSRVFKAKKSVSLLASSRTGSHPILQW